MTRYIKKQTGFTLIETIISITILAIAIIGPMTLSAQSIRASRDSRLHLEAIHLAEEGVEIIHNIRDNLSAVDTTPNRLSGTAVGPANLPDCTTGCTINASASHNPGGEVWDSQTVRTGVSATDAAPVCYHPSSGLYSQTSSGGCTAGGVIQSPFSRRVTITPIGPVSPYKQVRVTAVVSYRSTYGNAMRYATATTDVYNWFPCIVGSACP